MKKPTKKYFSAAILSLGILGSVCVGAGIASSQQAHAEAPAIVQAAPSGKTANFELTIRNFKAGETAKIYVKDAKTGEVVFQSSQKFTEHNEYTGFTANFDLPVGKNLHFGVSEKGEHEGAYTTIKMNGDGTMAHGEGYPNQFPGMIWELNGPTIQVN